MHLVSNISNLCDHNPPTSQTDRRTNGRTTCDLNTALAHSASRGKKEREGKERYKKSQNGYISRTCTKAPSEPILAKLGTSREVVDVITGANFGVCKLRGWGYTGVEFWHLPLKWLVTLTTVAQPVMNHWLR